MGGSERGRVMARDFKNEREEPSNGERARGTKKGHEGPSNSEREREGPGDSGRERERPSGGAA